MPQVNIQGIAVADDKVVVSGTVDGVEFSGQTWLSHLYPPKTQDPASSARGCQNDQDRVNHLSDILATAAGFTAKQKLADVLEQALVVLISKPDVPPVVIDPTIAKAQIDVAPTGK